MYLVYRLDDPVDARVATDGFVLRVDQDNLEILVGRVLVDPVRVQYSQIGTSAPNTFLGCRLERALVLQLIHTLIGRFAFKRIHQPLNSQCDKA